METIMQTKENNVLKPFFEEITINHNLNDELLFGDCFDVYKINCTVKNSRGIDSAFLTVEIVAKFKFIDDADAYIRSKMVNNQIYIIKQQNNYE